MSFDIRNFADTAHRVRDDDVDYSAFERQPLSDNALRALRYMSDVESHTICYLRDVLVTPSHKDPDVTAFMTMWAYEEFWHGEALDKVLRLHGKKADYGHIRDVRLAQGANDRWAPVYQATAANLIGEDFVAVHMTFGAINEWSAHAAYARMIQQEDHPELAKLLTRIQKQESRHLAFYATQARERLERSTRAQKITRFILKTWWTPVGSSIQPVSETEFLLNYLMGGTEGNKVITMLDDKVDKFPGLEGLQLVSKAAGSFGVGPHAAERKKTWGTKLRYALNPPALRA